MTQDYEPIKLSERTPEPREDGIYLLTITFKSETHTMPLYKDRNEYFDANSKYSWEEVIKEPYTADEVTIQSLANHDAQIRAEAWDEGHARGWVDGMTNAETTYPNPYRKNYLYKSNGLQHEEQGQ